jgi:agmatine deiminase
MRDCGPIFVYAGKEKLQLDWRFTGWAKYKNHKLDDAVPALINRGNQLSGAEPMLKGKRVVLEGGSIDVNGKGTLITTEECLLSEKVQCRNPGFSRRDYETIFECYLGAGNVIWLDKGIVGDDTHGHVDDITRFVNANTVVTVVEPVAVVVAAVAVVDARTKEKRTGSPSPNSVVWSRTAKSAPSRKCTSSPSPSRSTKSSTFSCPN